MKLKLLALAGIMAATMGLTACDSNKENAAEDLSTAEDKVQDASEQLDDAAAEGEAVPAEAEAEARRRREVEKVEEQKGCLMLGALPCLIIMVVAYFSEDLDWGSAFVLSGVIALFTIIYGLK